jgi:transposase
MKSLSHFDKIYVYRKPVDMRKQSQGLCILVQEEMGLDLMSNSVFLFCSRNRKILKLVYFDKSGFALWAKRLEESKFSWLKDPNRELAEVSVEDTELLLEGLDIWRRFEKLNYESVV